MTLEQIQRDFRAHIVSGSPAIEAAIVGDARRGLAVYHHAYRANLIACLRDSFEKTAAWLGDDAFERAALGHIEANPPRSWTLGVYGHGFDDTLATRFPADPEIAELAWLDWRLRRAFDGPDVEIEDPAASADLDWESSPAAPGPDAGGSSDRDQCAGPVEHHGRRWDAAARDAPR